MLKVRDLNVYYGGIHAIRGVDIDVQKGNIVTIIGSNGAGKRIEFTLNIKCVDDDPNAVLGDLRDVLKQYLPDGFSLPDIPKIPDMTNLF